MDFSHEGLAIDLRIIMNKTSFSYSTRAAIYPAFCTVYVFNSEKEPELQPVDVKPVLPVTVCGCL